MKARHDKMKLIEGDSETFNDVLGLIDDYEGKVFEYCVGQVSLVKF